MTPARMKESRRSKPTILLLQASRRRLLIPVLKFLQDPINTRRNTSTDLNLNLRRRLSLLHPLLPILSVPFSPEMALLNLLRRNVELKKVSAPIVVGSINLKIVLSSRLRMLPPLMLQKIIKWSSVYAQRTSLPQ